MPDGDAACFLDTNIWVYAFLPEGSAPEKRAIAQKLVTRANVFSSPQVVNEFCANAVRTKRFSEAQIVAAIESFYHRCRIVEPTKAVLLDASALRNEYSLSFWDSLVVASALEAEVPTLYSEDMHDGLRVRTKLRIVNPFARSRVG
jgi:predicted nucleic acid-binding protein